MRLLRTISGIPGTLCGDCVSAGINSSCCGSSDSNGLLHDIVRDILRGAKPVLPRQVRLRGRPQSHHRRLCALWVPYPFSALPSRPLVTALTTPAHPGWFFYSQFKNKNPPHHRCARGGLGELLLLLEDDYCVGSSFSFDDHFMAVADEHFGSILQGFDSSFSRCLAGLLCEERDRSEESLLKHACLQMNEPAYIIQY
jgi:hypothetical protein